jgi:hypothetical protein
MTTLSYQEQQDVIAAVEDQLILSLPHHVPLVRRIAIVNDTRRVIARLLADPTPPSPNQ